MTSVDAHNLSDLERILNHRFADSALLIQAITHKSAFDGKAIGVGGSYERLEFLGDRILGLVIADKLYRDHPEEAEGTLARRLNQLVSGQTCAQIATELGISPFIVTDRGAAGSNKTQGVLADACEAIIAAIYLDRGLPAATDFILSAWRERLAQQTAPLRDPKTALQEWTQAQGLEIPRYVQTDRSGPDHAPQFTVRVEVDGQEPAEAFGESKRKAQQRAAAKFLAARNLDAEDVYID